MKIFGRDPILWTAFTSAALTTLAVFHLGLSAGVAGAINGVIIAAVAIYATRPVTPGLFTGLAATIIALVAKLGVDLTDPQVTAINVLVISVYALITREQVLPQETRISSS